MLPKGLIFILGPFWSLLTCAGLGFTIYGIVRQIQALSFPITPGVVDSTKQTEASDGDGSSYGVKVAYHYDVGQKRYTSERLRFAETSSSEAWASATLRRFAAGTHPVVHYNPSNPGQAVLIVGIEGRDLFMALFMMPFTMVMLWIWAGAFVLFRGPRGFAGLRVVEEGSITRIRSTYWQAANAAGIVLLLTSFIVFSVVAIFFGGFDPTLIVAASAWGVVLTLSALAGMAVWRSIRGGDTDIIFDNIHNILTTPNGVMIAYAGINRVERITRIEPSQSSDEGSSRHYEVWVNHTVSGDMRNTKLQEWDEEGSARRFADWLAEKVGVAVEDGLPREGTGNEPQLPGKWRQIARRAIGKPQRKMPGNVS